MGRSACSYAVWLWLSTHKTCIHPICLYSPHIPISFPLPHRFAATPCYKKSNPISSTISLYFMFFITGTFPLDLFCTLRDFHILPKVGDRNWMQYKLPVWCYINCFVQHSCFTLCIVCKSYYPIYSTITSDNPLSNCSEVSVIHLVDSSVRSAGQVCGLTWGKEH